MTDYAFGQPAQDISFNNLKVRNTVGQCEMKIRAQCITANTVDVRQINIIEPDDVIIPINFARTQAPVEGDGSVPDPINLNPPLIYGSGFNSAGVGAGTVFVQTASYPNIVSNGLVLDDTSNTPGRFVFTVPGLYKINMSVDVIIPAIPTNTAFTTNIRALADGTPYAQDLRQYNTGATPQTQATTDHFNASTFIYATAGQDIILAKDTTTGVPVTWMNQTFSIEWMGQ
jgi:hypothetical protein